MTRTLQIQDVGDFHQNTIIPQILLKGKWLIEAGFQPDGKVAVVSKAKGTLEIMVIVDREVG